MTRRNLTEKEKESVSSILEKLRHRKLNDKQSELYRSIDSFFSWDQRLSDKQICALERLHRQATKAVYGTALSDHDRLNGKLNTVFNQIKNG